jgi:hypothetical protein
MITRKQYRKSQPYPQMYIVVNKDGEVFSGFIQGSIQWSHNWSKAKPLFEQNTSWLLALCPGAEVIKEEEII